MTPIGPNRHRSSLPFLWQEDAGSFRHSSNTGVLRCQSGGGPVDQVNAAAARPGVESRCGGKALGPERVTQAGLP